MSFTQLNVTLPRPEGGGKGFYPLSGEGSTERGGDTPRGRRPRGVSPTREVDPDTRGGKTFATEREGEVMSLFYDLRPRAIFWVYERVIAFRPGMRSRAQRDEARGFGGLPPF